MDILVQSLGWSFLFGIFDYIGFNTLGKINLPKYRIVQIIFQVLLFATLWWFESVWYAFGFLFIWWVWISDLFYYLLFDIVKMFGGDSAGTAFKREVLGNLVIWAWWTPVGLWWFVKDNLGNTGKWKKRQIPGVVLLIQAIVGIMVLSVINAILIS